MIPNKNKSVSLRILTLLAFGAAICGVPSVHAQGRDSLLQRLDNARALAREAGSQLDSLRRELERYSVSAMPGMPDAFHGISAEDSSIWREVQAEKRRRKELEEAFDYRRASVGYILNPNLIIGMNAIGWLGDWGMRVDGRVSMLEHRRALGGNLSVLYAIHEFYLTGEDAFTRLYAFAGSGYYWERRNISSDSWYNVPDRAFRAQFGVGTELGLRELFGTRFTPEIGFQGSRFLTRYKDSQDYTGSRSRSNFSLYPYGAILFNFYFL